MVKESEMDKLNEALVRLTQENALHRSKTENAYSVIRHRASNADGLTLEAGITSILNEKDKLENRIIFFRDEIRSILNFLLHSEEKDEKKVAELKKRINQFLVKNPK